MTRRTAAGDRRRRTVLAMMLGEVIGLVFGLIVGFMVVGDDAAGGQSVALLYGLVGLLLGGATGFAVARLTRPSGREPRDPELTGEMRRLHSEHTVRSQIAGYLRGGNQ